MFHSIVNRKTSDLKKAILGQRETSKNFKYINAVYYPSWRVYRGELPSSLNLSIISHVFYAFLRYALWCTLLKACIDLCVTRRAHEDGSIYFLDENSDTRMKVDGENGCLNAFKKLKRDNPHLKVVLSIGGSSGSASFPILAAEVKSRRLFASTAKDILIGSTHPPPKQGVDYVKLLTTLREYFPPSQSILTTALPAGEWCLRNIDLHAASKCCDFINLMTYDFAGSWTELSGHQAQLTASPQPHNAFAKRSIETGVEYLKAHGVPQEKTLIGIPVYGRSFLGATGTGQSFTGNGGENGIFAYKDLPRPGTQEVTDWERGAAFCVGGDGGFVSYDNPETVKMKAQFVKARKIAGLFYWTGTSDAAPPRSLVETGYRNLNG
ncbi:hypothetical protein N7528_007499 [Penicillium herquei]|nr:hypothetical protein N7528_007499 [Penicillium herquei]